MDRLRTPAIQARWPTTQSLDLVRATLEDTAKAMESVVTRFLKGEPVDTAWPAFERLADAIDSVELFTNIPTVFVAMPTHSPWTVLWNNCFLCDGYDALCAGITKHHGLETIHWSSHDDETTFEPGTSFVHRQRKGADIEQRSVYVGREGSRWLFHQDGQALPEEEIGRYAARLKREKLNERHMSELLNRLGARPWDESFYSVGTNSRFFRLQRNQYPATVSERDRASVIGLEAG